MHGRAAMFLLAVFVSACNASSPVAPTPQIPQVAGTYSGAITIHLPEQQESVSCPAQSVVSQSGSSVTIAPIVFGGSCNNISIPVGQATIGSMSTINGTFVEPGCGGSYVYTANAGIIGSELRVTMTATSPTCLNFNFAAVLVR